MVGLAPPATGGRRIWAWTATVLLEAAIELQSLDEDQIVMTLAHGPSLRVVTKGVFGSEFRLLGSNRAVVSPRIKPFEASSLLSISPDGRWIAAVDKDQLRVWNANTGYVVSEVIHLPSEILDARFTDDSNQLRVVTVDGVIHQKTVHYQIYGRPQWIETAAEGLTGLAYDT